ncbi:hypothetical protein EHN07_03830 [Buttiauxella warmboldiae]|uniref:Uncharacterized protein n=1 Tax=Buttiauxella warmboldiae TaxID=82993 RepID=A0A3N5DSU2_9ENTR|nr:hypothetical protein EHN07_03830 [Buttiauxella warmboldiae]
MPALEYVHDYVTGEKDSKFYQGCELCNSADLNAINVYRGQFGYRKLLYYKDFPGMSTPVFMASVCIRVKIKGRDCGTINGHDESLSIRTLMKDAREALVR